MPGPFVEPPPEGPQDPFASVRDTMEIPAGHVPALHDILPGCTVTTIEVPAVMSKDRGFACFLHQLACADGIIVLRPQGEGCWDKDDYISESECYAEIYELIDHRPMIVVNIAKGRIRSGSMMLPAMSSLSLATPNATFGFPEVHVGGIPAIPAVAIQKRIPSAAMRKMILMGDPVDATEAQRIGLVDFVGDVEMELARLLYNRCAPRDITVVWKPDVYKALEEEEAGLVKEE